MNIVSAQAISLVTLFCGMVVSFLLPIWWIQCKPHFFSGVKYRKVLNMANCLSGGVFLATFFVGLMPEIRSRYEQVSESSHYKFPTTEFVIFLGFLLALAIEQGILEYKEKREKPLIVAVKEETQAQAVCSGASPQQPSSVSGHGHSHHDIAANLVGDEGSKVRLSMLLISLGVHSIFEGLALGLQTSPAVLARLAVGVAMHELLMAFALGVSVSRLNLKMSVAWKLALLFSTSIPAGQVLGCLIGHYQSKTGLTISATLQGLAAGTFIHVTFMEIIPTEFNEGGHRLLKVLFLGLGFLLLLLCSVLMDNIADPSL